MEYAAAEYAAVEMEYGRKREDMEKLILEMKLKLRRNAGTMNRVGWKRGIMWVKKDGCAKWWVWAYDGLLRRLWMLHVGLLSGLLKRLRTRILEKGDSG